MLNIIRALCVILFFAALTACSSGINILPEPFTRERADGKIPVKRELIRQQVQRELAGMPEGEAEVARWQAIEADYHSCRLSSKKAADAAEEVFADCMANRGYVYMYPLDAEQLHNDIAFEMEKEYDELSDDERKAEEERIAAARKAEEDRRAAARKADEERIATEKKRQEEAEHHRQQKALDNALAAALNSDKKVNIAEVKRLIDEGADVNTKGKQGAMALHAAAGWGQTEFALALVKAGADIDAKENNGGTPLHFATIHGQTETAFALVKAGANIGEKDNEGLTPLHFAAEDGQVEIALNLIKAGADINAKSSRDNTPLHIATYESKIETVLVLVKAGADTEIKDLIGWTPLHVAAWFGHTEIIIALIKSGAYPNATTNDGRTPLDVARNNKQWSVVNILQNLPPPKPSGEQAPNVATAPAPEDSNVAEHVFEKAWRSVVYIETNGGQGGGVIIKPNIVATNCHVVDDGRIVVYKSHNRRTDKSKRYRATIRRRDDKNDFCLLDVSGLFGVPADVRRYDTLRIGESVYGIGAPQGLDLSLTSGLISQKRTEKGVRKIQTDTAISPGSSGGGLFDRKGNLIGIMTSKFVDEEVEGIGFAIPADLAL